MVRVQKKKMPNPIKIKLEELKEMSKEQLIDLILKQSIIPTPTCRPEYKFKTRISKRRRSFSPKPTQRSELPPRPALLLLPKLKRTSIETGNLKHHLQT